MDMYPGAVAWLQQPQQSQQQTLGQDPSSSAAPGPSASSPSLAPNQSVDLNDLFGGDLSTSTQALPTGASYFNNFANSNNIFFPPLAGQYNGGLSYQASSWNMQQAPVPLSNYSSLNGATTSHSPTQSSSQSPTQPTVIDPALTINNASSSTSYSPASSVAQPQPVQHSTSSSQQYNPYSHIAPSALSIPSYMQNGTHYHHSPSQSPVQSTMSPYTAQLISAIPPASFYSNSNGTSAISSASSSTSIAPSPVQSRKDRLLEAIAPALTTSGFVGEVGLKTLVSHIAEYGVQKVDALTRLDITNKIRDKAGNDYFQAWLKDATAMDITREWLKASATSSDSHVHETAMPLLHLVDRLPFTAESLFSSKLGRIVRKMAKNAPIPAVKDMASNLERRWRERFVEATPTQPMNVDEEPQVKKRKSSVPSSTKAAPPTKKIAVGSASSSKPVAVKKEGRDVKPASSTNMKESKSDSSFFSAPKPKPKLPSFKKAPPAPVKKERDTNIAQPSAINPFQEALKDMAKQRKASPAATTPTPSTPVLVDKGSSSQTPTGLTKSGKPKKMVTWAPDGQLELVKFIEKAVYDDDPVDGSHTMHNVRDLDRDEGAALHAHLFEEVVDWSEPNPVELPPDQEERIRGEGSQEKFTQAQREATALGAVYLLPAQIPDSPAEPSVQLTQEQVDADMRVMFAGADLEAVVSQWPPPDDTNVEPAPSVSDLVGQLAGMDQHQLVQGVSRLQADPNMVAQLTPEQIQHVMQLLGITSSVPQDPNQLYPPPAPASQAWQGETDGYYAQQQQQYPEPNGDRHNRAHWQSHSSSENQWGGGGGRGGFGRGGGRGGRGRGKSRIPCSFFAQGRCKFGDQCDFSHEPGASNYG